MNLLHIAGRLGADPETRFTASGQKVTTFRVAVNVRKSGKDETIWYRATIWGDRFEKMLPYLKKGSAVIVIGTLQKPEIYTDKEGRPQISLEITAEMIQFSPFGKEEREGQSAEAPGSFGHQPQGYGARPQPAAPSQPMEYDYSSSSGTGGGGYRFDQPGSGYQEEENMPF